MAAPLKQEITFKLSGKVAKNRIYRSPMSEYASTYDENNRAECGKPLPAYVKRYQRIADGGASLICLGNIPIHRDFLENKENAVLDPDNPWDAVEAFRPAITAAKSRGAICLGQLQYPGRQCPDVINRHPKSASDVQLKPCLQKTYEKPTPLSIDDIADLKRRYQWAAEQLVKAGADGIILHASHGYVISQFLSPLTNKRTDMYGGSLENRARFLLEVVAAIRERLPTDRFIIAAKYNCHDFIEGGTTVAEAAVVAKWLEEAGVDFFDISGGTYESPAWRVNIMKELAERPWQAEWGSVFVEWAKDLKLVLSRAVVGTTGGWRQAHYMSEAVRRGYVDMIGLGRPLVVEPDLPNKIFSGASRESKL